MIENYPNLKMYFNALNIYMLGDLLVFDKNCQIADSSDYFYGHTYSSIRWEDLMPHNKPPYSSIYPLYTGSNPSASYIENPNPRLAIPLALTLFSVIELIGIFYTGRTDPRSTTMNINMFFEKLPIADKPNKKDIEILIKMFRHGLVHQYFAKSQYSISYSLSNPDQLFLTHKEKCLNVNYLKKLFLLGFDRIQKDISSFDLMEKNVSALIGPLGI